MEWLDLLKSIGPISGPVGVLLLTLLLQEKREHAKTREDLKQSQEARVAEAKALIEVVVGTTEASRARDESQREITQGFRTVSAALNQLLLTVGGRR